MFARLRHGLRNLLRRNQVERELAEEIDAHVELLVEEKVARGVSTVEAYRAARLEVGRLTALKEDIRDVRAGAWLDVLHQDVRFSLRWMRRSPLVTLALIATLAIVIGSAVTVFSITDAWLLRPLAFPNAGRLVVAFAATSSHPDEPAVWMPYRSYLAFKESARSFTSVSAAAFQPVTWRSASGAKSIVGMRVTPEFFSTLGVSPMRGRALDASDAVTGSRVVVLSYGLWQRGLGGEEHHAGGLRCPAPRSTGRRGVLDDSADRRARLRTRRYRPGCDRGPLERPRRHPHRAGRSHDGHAPERVGVCA
jgi:hypothetical protein